MISIREFAGVLHTARREKRRFLLFRFYCDESYDGKAANPDYFTISGFFSDQPTWEDVEDEWDAVNRRYGVNSFHGTELNGRTGRYKGWCKSKGCEYSAELLNTVNRQNRRMRAYNCGIRGDAYRKIISQDARIKMGHPWMVCFKSIVAMVAKDMETLPRDDRFSVVFGHENRFDAMALESFWMMMENPDFEYRHRLMTCTPALPRDVIGLQVADLMAYEYYKRMEGVDRKSIKRVPIIRIQEHNDYCEGFFGEDTFVQMKDSIESAICGPNSLVIIPNL
jgi:hypothetical protein